METIYTFLGEQHRGLEKENSLCIVFINSKKAYNMARLERKMFKMVCVPIIDTRKY